MSEVDACRSEDLQQPLEAAMKLGWVSMALVLPVLSGFAHLFLANWPGLALGLVAATVVASAAFVAMDARRLGRVDLDGKERDGAGILFIGMCLFWVVLYPLAFFRRRSFGGPNLGFVSVAVAAFFVGVSIVRPLLVPAPLPLCTSSEVKQLLEQLIRGMPIGATTHAIDGHRELSFDRDAEVRHGECIVHTEEDDITVKFLVQWRDRDRRLFEIRIAEPDLPACSSPAVVRLLEQIIRSTPLGAVVQSIDGHREERFDQAANIRYGECVVHTAEGDIPVKFLVQWQDREKGLFQVETIAATDEAI